MAHSSTYLRRGPSLPAWLPSPLLPPAQTAILLSLLTVAAAIIFLGCALWKDAKKGSMFLRKWPTFFSDYWNFFTTLWSHFTECLHFIPSSRPHFIPSRTNLIFVDFSRKRSEALSSPIRPFVSEGVREDALSPKILSVLSAWVLLRDCLYSGSSAATVFCWCFSRKCSCYRLWVLPWSHLSYVPVPSHQMSKWYWEGKRWLMHQVGDWVTPQQFFPPSPLQVTGCFLMVRQIRIERRTIFSVFNCENWELLHSWNAGEVGEGGTVCNV